MDLTILRVMKQQKYVTFCVWFLNVFCGSSLLKHASVLHFLLWLNIPLYGYTTFCLYIQWWVASTFWLLWSIMSWTQCTRFYVNLLTILLGYIPRRELLGHMVTLSLTYWGTSKVFLTVAIPFYILTTSLSTVVTAHFFFFLITDILVSVKWYLTVFLIYIS